MSKKDTLFFPHLYFINEDLQHSLKEFYNLLTQTIQYRKLQIVSISQVSYKTGRSISANYDIYFRFLRTGREFLNRRLSSGLVLSNIFRINLCSLFYFRLTRFSSKLIILFFNLFPFLSYNYEI